VLPEHTPAERKARSQLNIFQDMLQAVLGSLRGELFVATTHANATDAPPGSAPVLELWEECAAGRAEIAELRTFLRRLGFQKMGPLSVEGIKALARHLLQTDRIGGDGEEHLLFVPGGDVEFYRRAAGFRILLELCPHHPAPRWFTPGMEKWNLMSEFAASKDKRPAWKSTAPAAINIAGGTRKEGMMPGPDRNFTPAAIHPLSKKQVSDVDDLRVMFATTAMEDTHELLRESIEKLGRATELYGSLEAMETTTIQEGVGEEGDFEDLEGDDNVLARILANREGEGGDRSVAGRATVFSKRKQADGRRAVAAVDDHRLTDREIRAFDVLRAVYVGQRTRMLMTEQQAEHVAAARIQLKWWYYYARRINAARRIQAWFRCMIFREILQGCMIAKQAVAEALEKKNAKGV
jgi:hypothetical protein